MSREHKARWVFFIGLGVAQLPPLFGVHVLLIAIFGLAIAFVGLLMWPNDPNSNRWRASWTYRRTPRWGSKNADDY